MKRLLLVAALVGVASSCLGARYALLVGVDKYPFITDPARQLRGAETDTSLMKRMLALYGFQSTVLLREEATRKRIIEELAKLDGQAKRGDEVVFYFSGRGSIAPGVGTPNSKTDYEPTLVPADGSATALDPDLRIRRFEDWAKTLDVKGAAVTIILDASFQSPTRSDFGRQYNPTPRSIQRSSTAGGEVRDELYTGPGVFVSACPAKGSAYEWLINSSQGRWAGAFTDQLVNSVVAGLNRGENPSVVDAMREVQAYFKDKVRADYMPGLAPYPSMEDLMEQGARYGVPLLGGLNAASLPPDSKAALAALERVRQERERKFWVALEVADMPSEAERKALYAKCAGELRSYLTAKLPNSEFAPEGAPPDVIVQVKQAKSLIEASVTGDDLDKARVFTFPAKDMPKALDIGLGQYLELRSLVARMYRLTATESPTWEAPLKLSSDGVAYSRGDTFGLDVEAPAGSLLFILDRDDSDGILQLAFPQVGAPYSQKLTGPLRLGAKIKDDTTPGRMMLRAIVVPSAGKVTIAEAPMADERKFREALIRQLRAVVSGMEKKQVPWAAKTINLRIR
jgi:hypothetical protein